MAPLQTFFLGDQVPGAKPGARAPGPGPGPRPGARAPVWSQGFADPHYPREQVVRLEVLLPLLKDLLTDDLLEPGLEQRQSVDDLWLLAAIPLVAVVAFARACLDTRSRPSIDLAIWLWLRLEFSPA